MNEEGLWLLQDETQKQGFEQGSFLFLLEAQVCTHLADQADGYSHVMPMTFFKILFKAWINIDYFRPEAKLSAGFACILPRTEMYHSVNQTTDYEYNCH